MKKRILSVFIALAMTLTLLPPNALGVEDGDVSVLSPPVIEEPDLPDEQPADVPQEGEGIVVEQVEHFTVPDAEALPDNDELFAGYVEQQLYGDLMGDIQLFAANDLMGNRLEGDLTKKAYTLMAQKIKSVAEKGGSTDFAITPAELGLEKTEIKLQATDLGLAVNTPLFTTDAKGELTGLTPDANTKINSYLESNGYVVDGLAIVSALLVDLPYDLYWFNKTVEYSAGELYGRIGMERSTLGSTVTDTITLSGNATFTLKVASAYQDGSDVKVSATKATAAKTSADNAAKIAEKYADKSDYEKLVGYRTEICNLVSYNSAAIGTAYGDPWQLIHVFDDDPSTNVVCEGYAKAFQYLCDLGGINCYLVTGKMTGGTGAGDHMWNVVTLDDKNYLVDVTNCDEGTVGAPDKLFLRGGAATGTQTWTVGGVKYPVNVYTFDGVQFSYDGETASMYPSDVLTLSTENYNPSSYTINVADNIVYNGQAVQIIKKDSTTSETAALTWEYTGDGEAGTPTAKWYTGSVSGNGNDTAPKNAGTYWVVLSVGDEEVARAQFTIKPATLTGIATATVTPKTYDGKDDAELSALTLSGVFDNELSLDNGDYTATAKFTDVNAGTPSVDVTVTLGNNVTNYVFEGGVKAKTFSQANGTTITGTIDKAEIISTGLTWSVADNYEVTYDGNVHAVTLNGADQAAANGFSVETSGTFSATNAGDYTATATLTADKNHTLASGITNTMTLSWKIKKAACPVSTKAATVRSDVATTGATIDLPALPAGVTYGTVTVTTDTSSLITRTPTVSGTTMTLDTAAKSADTTATVTVAVNGGTNYVDGELTVTIKATPKETVTITGVSVDNTVYGTAVQPKGTPVVQDNKVHVDQLQYIYKDSNENIVTAPKAAGAYTLIVQVPESNADYTGSLSVPFQITQKPITARVTGTTTKPYDGTTALPGATLTLDGVVGEDVVSATSISITAANANADTQNVIVEGLGLTGAAAGNYSVTLAANQTCTITKVPVTVSGVTATSRPYAQGNTTVELNLTGATVSGAVTGETLDVSGGTGRIADANAGAGKAVTVSGITLTGSTAANYTLTQPTGVTVNITPSDAALENKTDEVKHAFNVSGAQTAINLAALLPDAGPGTTYAVTSVTDATPILDGAPAVDAAGKLTYSLKGQASFADQSATIVATVTPSNYSNTFTYTLTVTLLNKLPQTAPADFSLQYAVEADDEHYSVTIPAVAGDVEYRFNGGAWSSNNVLTGVSPVATVVGEVRFKENATHLASPEATATLTLPRMVTANPQSNPVPGTFTNSVTVTLTSATANASIYYTLDGTEPVAGSAEQLYDPDKPIVLTNTTTVKAIAVRADRIDSEVVTLLFTRYIPSSGGSPVTPVTPVVPNPGGSSNPSSSNNNNNNTSDTNTPSTPPSTSSNAPVAPEATVSGGTATAEVTGEQASQLVDQAASGNSTVTIAPEVSGDVTRTEVSIPASAVSGIANGSNAELKVETPVASVTIPNSGLAGLSGQDVTVAAEKVGNTVSVEVTAGGRVVENISGGVKAEIPAQCGPGTVAQVVDESGNVLSTVRKSFATDGGQTMSVPLDGSAKVVFVDNGKSFADVPAGNWASNAVAFASGHELMNGVSATSFSPSEPMTRSMLAVVLHNLEGNPSASYSGGFGDVASNAWYAEAVQWAADNSIVTGTGEGTFAPDASITREQLVVMLYRYAGQPTAGGNLGAFSDAASVSSWAQQAMAWAVSNGIVNGANGALNPQGGATRAEVAQMLMNFVTSGVI